MKQIPLTQGKFALVDDDDYDYLIKFNWFLNNTGYASRNSPRGSGKRKQIMMHRVIMCTPDELVCDHKDGDKLNNQKQNLRNCSYSDNSRNMKKHSNASSEYKGVSWHKATSMWQSQIEVNGRNLYLGVYEDEISAAIAYNNAALENFMDYSKLNKIPQEFLS
jgi:hypothetical protein